MGDYVADTPNRRFKRRLSIVSSTLGLVATAAIAVVELWPSKSSTSTPSSPTPTPKPVTSTVVDAAPPPATLAAAIAASRPTSLDDDLGDPLVHYAAAKLRWTDVATADTTLLKADKDVAGERGKRLCATGTITEIARRDVDKRKVFVGRLGTDDGDQVWFVAVGSTGELVKRSAATLCGVVAARTHGAVGVVGMFDLPENKTPTVEQ